MTTPLTGPLVLRVAILGCGPAGLLAAHAARQAGFMVQILADKHKSVISGAQFLHDAIPELTHEYPDGQVTFEVRGSAEVYALKVYGEQERHLPSPPSFAHVMNGQKQDAWWLREAYERLWYAWQDQIRDVRLDADDLEQMISSGYYDGIISTIPKRATCTRPGLHRFRSQPISIIPDLPFAMEPNTILYDGTKEVQWYRASVINGSGWMEYGGEISFPGALPGVKPINNTCDCWPQVCYAGRFGTWTKGILTHHAYLEASEYLDQMKG